MRLVFSSGAIAIGVLLLFTSPVFAQTPPALEFEVASVKPSQAPPGNSDVHEDRGRLSMRNVTLKRCIRGAYNIPETLVFGGPKWVDDERYDIQAKAASPAGDHDMMIMLQALLADRFKLVYHRETRPTAGYALVVAKGGLKAQPSADDAHSRTNSRRDGIDAQASTMADLAQKLSDTLHLPVADLTATRGRFDFHVQWTPEDSKARPPSAGEKATGADPGGPSIFAALQEQLGLKLESRKVAVEVLVIDRAEKASEN